jgi:hypothetical protein
MFARRPLPVIHADSAPESSVGGLKPSPAGHERLSSAVHLRATAAPPEQEEHEEHEEHEVEVQENGAPGDDEDPLSKTPEGVRRTEERLLSAIKTSDLPNALTLASVLVYMDPSHAIAQRIKKRCANQMDSARTRAFPRHDAIPRQCIPWSELRRRTLSRSEAFLLWCIDGRSTVEQVIDTSAMSPLVAFETLDDLIREGIVDLSAATVTP